MAQEPGTRQDADKLANAKEGGRYGAASPDKPHMSPEIAPRGREGIVIPDDRVKEIGGALPENRGFKEKLLEEESSSADWGE